MLVPNADNEIPLLRTFQQDHHLKHTPKFVKQWFETNPVEVMKCPAQSPVLIRMKIYGIKLYF